MGEIKNSLEEQIKFVANKFLDLLEKDKKEIQIVSHFDTDGITSATIMIQALKKIDRIFSIKILKSLEEESIKNLSEDKITIFLDLASGSLNYLEKSGLKDIFIIDHHELTQEIPEKINIINSELHCKQKISGSSLTYLFCKQLLPDYKKGAKLAILGMVGDRLETEIGKLNNNILEDGEIKTKRGLLIYPSTRPLNKVLEYCSQPYIPGVTGNPEGVKEILRESNLFPKNKKYPNLIELNNDEMEKLTTSIMLRNPKTQDKSIIGDIFLIKLFNKLEDAREISALINACSRSGRSDIAIQFLLENPEAKRKAETIHIKHRQQIISALKFASDTQKIQGNGFTIINAKDQIKDTIIGTIASILSNSPNYEEGTIIIGMAYYQNKIKVSARSVGRNGRNIRDILCNITAKTGGEAGGHKFAAGCIIQQEKEKEFIDLLKKNLEIEIVKI